jgi:G:T-mismatch repair DNA endonuclease (very short patch repair protein)
MLKASEIWSLDHNRQLKIEKIGYSVLHVWETEYYSNTWQQKCINFLEKFVDGRKKEKNINAL